MHWIMEETKETEFKKKIARMIEVCWFEAKADLVCTLPPGAYTVSWRAKLADYVRGWANDPVTFTFSKTSERNCKEVITRCKCYLTRPCRYEKVWEPEPRIYPVPNGWLEYDVGKLYVKEGEGLITLNSTMMQTKDAPIKRGLLLDGLVIRPCKTPWDT